MNAVVIFLLISVSGLFAVHSDIDIAKLFASYFYYVLYIQQPDDKELDDVVNVQVDVPYEKKYMDKFECMEDVEVSKEKMGLARDPTSGLLDQCSTIQPQRQSL